MSVSLNNNNEFSSSINHLSEILKNAISSPLTPCLSSSTSSSTTTASPTCAISSLIPYPSISSSSTTASLTSSLTPCPSTSSLSMTISPTKYYTLKDILFSKENNNWLVPYKMYTSVCFACSYFSHSYKECPNLSKEITGMYISTVGIRDTPLQNAKMTKKIHLSWKDI
ncbi:hypothetical protein C1645_139971 [Glomus cerebriforme]|uniref:Uncharacterized protein n=1 Tax=Glomus cerebriforme TaxID=658196 RepID=A0A397S9K6_9GLOM|nr:hypothetical protein C1645_139971 [Glomus cerebriforme]